MCPALEYIACSRIEEGRQESLGFYLNLRESYYGWKAFLQSLKERGLSYCFGLWIRDQFDGFAKALGECFPGQLSTSWRITGRHYIKTDLDKAFKLMKKLKNGKQDIKINKVA